MSRLRSRLDFYQNQRELSDFQALGLRLVLISFLTRLIFIELAHWGMIPSIPIQLIAVVVGGIITLAGSLTVNLWDNRRQKLNLKKALVTEVLIISNRTEKLVLSGFADTPSDFENLKEEFRYPIESEDINQRKEALMRDNVEVLFPTELYESNLGNIGNLGIEPIPRLVIFYAKTKRLKQALKASQSGKLSDVKQQELGKIAEGIIRDRSYVLNGLNVSQEVSDNVTDRYYLDK